jgi:hypothetical protein
MLSVIRSIWCMGARIWKSRATKTFTVVLPQPGHSTDEAVLNTLECPHVTNGSTMSRIFIIYRRAGAEYAAGSLGRELRRRFGDEQVFRDKEDIRGGVSWKQRVLGDICRGSALLVLMERNWAAATDAHGRRRLDNTDDPVRIEIADGLTDGATVIPVLLENAEMPAANELPEEIRPMAELNALKLRDGDWQHDVDSICELLKKYGFQLTPANSSPSIASVDSRDATQLRQVRSSIKWRTVGATLLVFLGALGYAALHLNPHRSGDTKSTTPYAQKQAAIPQSAPPAAQKLGTLPHLDYGVWTLHGVVDVSGKHFRLDDSVLKFTSQSETADGLLLQGTFTWRLDGVLLGTEMFKGQYVGATRRVFFEGTSLKRASGPTGQNLVLGSYSALLSADDSALLDGRLGSTADDAQMPGRWEAVR